MFSFLLQINFLHCVVASKALNFFITILVKLKLDLLIDVVDLAFHLGHLASLQVQHLQEAEGQRVDLVSHRGQRLGHVIFGLL